MSIGFNGTTVKKGVVVIICLLLLTACVQQTPITVSDGSASWSWVEEDGSLTLDDQEQFAGLGEQEELLASDGNQEEEEESPPSPAYLKSGILSWKKDGQLFTIEGYVENTGGTEANSFTVIIYYKGALGQVYEKYERTLNRSISPEGGRNNFKVSNTVTNYTKVKYVSAGVKLNY